MRGAAIATIAVLCLCATGQASAADAPAEADTTGLAELSPAELFLRASSSALQFAPLREPSRRHLVSNHAESLPYLMTKLSTDDARERHALEDILVRIGSPAIQPLAAAFESETRRTDTTRGARLAALVLGRLGAVEAAETLAGECDHDDWKVRSSIGEALGRIGVPGSASALVTLLGDENEIVRKSAAVALGRVAHERPDGDGLGESAREALIAALGDRCYCVRYGAARALAECGEAAVPDLLDLAESSRGLKPCMAIVALGDCGSRSALKTLRRLLGSEDWAIRAYAAEAIGKIGPRLSERRLLRRRLADEHPFVVQKAREALETIGG